MTRIVSRSAQIICTKIDDNGAAEIAARSRGTPRIANRLLRRVRDYSEVKADGSIISPSGVGSSGFFRGRENGLEQGDTIVVPLQIQPFSTIKATTEVTQIIYQMALAAAAVNSF